VVDGEQRRQHSIAAGQVQQTGIDGGRALLQVGVADKDDAASAQVANLRQRLRGGIAVPAEQHELANTIGVGNQAPQSALGRAPFGVQANVQAIPVSRQRISLV
jgi:hypothetical protein